MNGRIVLVADHTKQPKDARKIPEVTTMRKDSETSSRRPSKNAEPQHSSNPERTLSTLSAIENFVAATVVAHGILQYISLSMPEQIIRDNRCWMRTPPRNIPSEFVTRHAVRTCIGELLKSSGKSWIACLIQGRQDKIFDLNSETDIFGEEGGF